MESKELNTDSFNNSNDAIILDMENALKNLDLDKETEEPLVKEESVNGEPEGSVILDEVEIKEPTEEIESLDQQEDGLNEVLEEDEVNQLKKAKDKARKALNEKHRLLAELTTVREKLKEVEDYNNELRNSGIYHYEKNIDAEIEKAQENYVAALGEGDSTKLNKAMQEMMDATIRKKELSKHKADNYQPQYQPQYQEQQAQYQPNQYQQPQYDPYSVVKQEIVKDWIVDHPYLIKGSKSFDPDLLAQVDEYVAELDNKISNSNRPDLYFSDDYFKLIDKRISSLRNNQGSNQTNRTSVAPVSGVRNSYSYDGKKKTNPKVSFTDYDQNWVDTGWLTKEQILKAKAQHNREENR